MKPQPRNPFEEQTFKLLKKHGNVEYETEKLPYILANNYIPDFPFTTKKGKKFYIETKGEFDALARRKMVAVKVQHPDKDFRIVFYRAATKLRKGSKTTYGMWATKNGFIWADKVPPPAWFKE